MSLSKILGPTAARKPHKIVTLTPDDFADRYEGRPRSNVAIGLLMLGERDVDVARAQAAKHIADPTMFTTKDGGVTDEQARDEAYNDALVRWAVAKATCNPNDVSQPYFDMAEDTIAIALRPEAIRFLWDELILLSKGKGSVAPPATDEEIAAVVDMLDRGLIKSLAETNQVELRKLLAHVHAVLSVVDETDG